ncbi:hypothetical protein Y600_5993 [Burkholderia pseudomallei MSHR3709]|nr:hypothetical protein Y600_5993 [Burkholderia pseudomallei MSHR3709]
MERELLSELRCIRGGVRELQCLLCGLERLLRRFLGLARACMLACCIFDRDSFLLLLFPQIIERGLSFLRCLFLLAQQADFCFEFGEVFAFLLEFFLCCLETLKLFCRLLGLPFEALPEFFAFALGNLSLKVCQALSIRLKLLNLLPKLVAVQPRRLEALLGSGQFPGWLTSLPGQELAKLMLDARDERILASDDGTARELG